MTDLETNAWDFAQWTALGLMITAAIYFGLRSIITLVDYYRDAIDNSIINNLQTMVFELPQTSENFDKIEIEFDKLGELDEVSNTLHQAFYNRFAKIAEKRHKTNFTSQAMIKQRIENEIKDLNSQLEIVKKDLLKCKNRAESIELYSKEDSLKSQLSVLTKILSIKEEVFIEKPKRKKRETVIVDNAKISETLIML